MSKHNTETEKVRSADDTCAYVHGRIGMRCGGRRANHELRYTDHDFKKFEDAPQPAPDGAAEKSPRKIAERLVTIVEHQSGLDLASSSRPNMLIDAIEKALRDRDERAAKIADGVQDEWIESAKLAARYSKDLVGGLAQSTHTSYAETAGKIASAIRGKS